MRFPSFLAVATCLAVPVPLQAQSGLIGAWARDTARSDSPQDALRAAVQGSATRRAEPVPFTVVRGDGESRRPATRPPRTDAAEGSAFDPAGRAVDRAVASSLLNTATVRFDESAASLSMRVGDGPPIPLQPGSRTVSRWGLDDLTMSVKLSADAVELDTRGPEGLRVRERYALTRSGELEARITAERRGLRSAARVKYVYARRDDG